ncbi:2-amino-4-hydroxy-6-hydroxymethyldihydropteridine diphosphokinase [Aliidiomarina sp. Khilg15.8]
MTLVYLGLGANLDNPLRQLQAAVQAIQVHPALKLLACSSFYGSKPMGPQDQPDYVNAVACVQSELAPLPLLDTLQRIENEAGRVREQRWGPRTLDIDILLIDDQVIDAPRLQVPHPGIGEREFVLHPLYEIAPHLILPDGQTILALKNAIPANGLHKIAPSPDC